MKYQPILSKNINSYLSKITFLLLLLLTGANGEKKYSGNFFKQTADITLTENWVPIGKDATS